MAVTDRWIGLAPTRLSRAMSRLGAGGQALLDAPLAVAMVMIFFDLVDAGFLFHVAFLVLAANAFLRGLRSTIRRLVLISAFLAAYVIRSLVLAGGIALDLAEWPLMMLIALLVAWLADRREMVARHYAGLYEKVAATLTNALEAERKRLAREVHDSLGQSYASLAITLDAAEAALEKGHAPQALGAVREARRLSSDALEATRDIANELRPANLVEGGLPFAVGTRVRRVLPDVAMELDADGYGAHELSPLREAELYRCLQEAIANVARHARARTVKIRLEERDGGVVATVQDDGVGFDVERVPEGLGITGMRERATLLNGEVRLTSRPGGGTSVVIRIPRSAEAGSSAP